MKKVYQIQRIDSQSKNFLLFGGTIARLCTPPRYFSYSDKLSLYCVNQQTLFNDWVQNSFHPTTMPPNSILMLFQSHLFKNKRTQALLKQSQQQGGFLLNFIYQYQDTIHNMKLPISINQYQSGLWQYCVMRQQCSNFFHLVNFILF